MYAAVAVPMTAAILFVPSATAGEYVGKASRSTGMSSTPPPPTTASTQPAAVAATSRPTTSYRSTLPSLT